MCCVYDADDSKLFDFNLLYIYIKYAISTNALSLTRIETFKFVGRIKEPLKCWE